MKVSVNPDSLFNNIRDQKYPPIEQWDPPFCGDIDICIHRDGSWSYNNSPFTRTSLVKLFARVLKREGNDYFLLTPVEKVKIKVEAEPFITVAVEQNTAGPMTLAFRTSLDETVIADKEHPITVINDSNGRPYPTIHIRNNLHALISRSDFYQLVELASSETDTSSEIAGASVCTIESSGCKFILGKY